MKKQTVLIGVIGTGEHVGTTHFCIMLSVFMSVVKGKKVAYAEMNDSGCLRQATETFGDKIKKIFSIYDMTEADIPTLLLKEYDYIIVDFGKTFDLNRENFLRCNRKIAVGSLSWWKFQEYVLFMVKTAKERTRRSWAYLCVNPVKHTVKYIRKNFDVCPTAVPCEPDPLKLTKESLNFLEQFTKDNL